MQSAISCSAFKAATKELLVLIELNSRIFSASSEPFSDWLLFSKVIKLV